MSVRQKAVELGQIIDALGIMHYFLWFSFYVEIKLSDQRFSEVRLQVKEWSKELKDEEGYSEDYKRAVELLSIFFHDNSYFDKVTMTDLKNFYWKRRCQ